MSYISVIQRKITHPVFKQVISNIITKAFMKSKITCGTDNLQCYMTRFCKIKLVRYDSMGI
jgi:hypothetical protein